MKNIWKKRGVRVLIVVVIVVLTLYVTFFPKRNKLNFQRESALSYIEKNCSGVRVKKPRYKLNDAESDCMIEQHETINIVDTPFQRELYRGTRSPDFIHVMSKGFHERSLPCRDTYFMGDGSVECYGIFTEDEMVELLNSNPWGVQMRKGPVPENIVFLPNYEDTLSTLSKSKLGPHFENSSNVLFAFYTLDSSIRFTFNYRYLFVNEETREFILGLRKG